MISIVVESTYLIGGSSGGGSSRGLLLIEKGILVSLAISELKFFGTGISSGSLSKDSLVSM